DGREAADLAAARVGDARLDAQGVVVAPLVDVDGNAEVGLASGVKSRGAFARLLLAAPPVVAALARLFVAPAQRRVVRLAVRDPGATPAGHGLAEVVARRDRHVRLAVLDDELVRRRGADFELGLPV